MSEELGKIEKPPAEDYKGSRKLFFIPLLYCGKEDQSDYSEIFTRYWEQVRKQITELEIKLGKIGKIYHELISTGSDEGCQTIQELNDNSHRIVQNCIDRGARLEALEDDDLLSEFMDWSRCLVMGLQNQNVFTKVYDSYVEVSKKRNEHIAGKIDETLAVDEIGVFLMRENHQIQFPKDIQVFYISPPALDEIKRWQRDHEAKSGEE